MKLIKLLIDLPVVICLLPCIAIGFVVAMVVQGAMAGWSLFEDWKRS